MFAARRVYQHPPGISIRRVSASAGHLYPIISPWWWAVKTGPPAVRATGGPFF